MQEFEPITKDNIEDVLKYNGWEYCEESQYYQTENTNGDFTIEIEDNPINYYFTHRHTNHIHKDTKHFQGIDTHDFDEFLAFVQKRIELKPIPKKLEFVFEQYLLDNGFKKNQNGCSLVKNNLMLWVYYDGFELQDTPTYAKTKENADMLIAATEFLDELK
jgi:hypothetical protein